MPNHLHGIIILVGAGPRACPDKPRQPQGVDGGPGRPQGVADESGQPQGVAPTLSLPDVVHRFKSLTTARYRQAVRDQGWPPFAGRLWQRNYYEHVIRGEDELDRVRQYIAENPLRWDEDPENPEVAQAAGDHMGSPLHANGGQT
ncbi:MAG: transposase [Dehalococcoidia bacterium]|nr:transposase [Dehalococcoidia bacterium]